MTTSGSEDYKNKNSLVVKTIKIRIVIARVLATGL